eukprot:maker-scaffold_4-snap-gene-2.46-mRNA-1 protein AED:0.00 eAED:0.00 QI:214/1/1/1/1/1/2/201/224
MEKVVQNIGGLVSNLEGLKEIFDGEGNEPGKVFDRYLVGYQKTDSKDNLYNEELKKLKSKVLNASQSSVETLQDLKTEVQLLIPKVEDGGNFGVRIQMQLVKMLKEELEDIEKVYDSVTGWYEKRGSAVAKIEKQVTVEVKENTIEQAIGDDKTGTSKSTSRTEKAGNASTENLEGLANLDMKMFLDLKKSVRGQISILKTVAKFIDNNKDKLETPRSGFDMYG